MSLQPTSYINGMRLFVPPEYAGILPVSPSRDPYSFEPLCFRGLSAAIEPGATVYDVGASFGIMTALIGLLSGDQGQVVSFEPNPAAMQLGKLLLERNGMLGRVRQMNVLVGEASTGGIPFFFVPGPASVASTRNTDIVHFHPDAVKAELEMIAMDEFDGPAPSVVKVDIEGSEYQFLRGAQRFLEKHQPDLVIETHANEIDGIAGSTLELCQGLEELGYRLWNLEANAATESATYATEYATRIGNLLASARMDEISPRLNPGY